MTDTSIGYICAAVVAVAFAAFLAWVVNRGSR